MDETWIVKCEERDKREAEKAGLNYLEDLRIKHNYVVVIPEDVYDQLSSEQQEKFDKCDLTEYLEDEEIVDDYGVEPHKLNNLWQRKFYDLPDEEFDKWKSLGNPNSGKPVTDVQIICSYGFTRENQDWDD